MELRLDLHARPRQVIVALATALALVASPALAMPKKRAAKSAFEKGAKAYKKNDFAGARDAFAKSYGQEADPDTLFAWAQAEAKLDNCGRAIELWERLAKFDLPAENREAVRLKIDECKATLGANPSPTPVPEPTPTPTPTPTPVPPEPTPDPTPTPVVAPVPDPVRPPEPPEPQDPPSKWKDPLGLSMIGLGLVGLGVGGAFMFQANAAEQEKADANMVDHEAFLDARDRAESKGKIGVIGLAAGGALLVGGFVWILTRSPKEQPVLGAWADGDGGGVVLTGGF